MPDIKSIPGGPSSPSNSITVDDVTDWIKNEASEEQVTEVLNVLVDVHGREFIAQQLVSVLPPDQAKKFLRSLR